MINLKINGLPSFVPEGATVLDAANAVFVHVPTLCHLKGCEPEASCMLCVVKDLNSGQLIPACSAKALEGMEIVTESEDVQAARRDILNLLLSEHVGDCEAPCSRICPAHLDIPLMLREIERGNLGAAGWIAKRDLALPATLGHVCPAPCEKGCRRGRVDASITIRKLHLDAEAEVGSRQGLDGAAVSARRVAVFGAGPAGLSCAWALVQKGFGCRVFDEADDAGGELRKHKALPLKVLDAEIEWLEKAGVEFCLGHSLSMHDIARDYQGIVFAESKFSGTHFADAFYAEEHKLTVKSIANGKKAADAVIRFLGDPVPAEGISFDSRIGKLRDSEIEELMKNCSGSEGRAETGEGDGGQDTSVMEAARCLHCDCRKPASCKLRKYADQYGADQKEFPAGERRHLTLVGAAESVIFEPGKCIKCGLCIKVSKQAGEKLGLSFVGRGYNSEITVPFENALEDGLAVSAEACVSACPTGALVFASTEEAHGSP
jgi:ferredoxin